MSKVSIGRDLLWFDGGSSKEIEICQLETLISLLYEMNEFQKMVVTGKTVTVGKGHV